jgi:hypothetical protein
MLSAGVLLSVLHTRQLVMDYNAGLSTQNPNIIEANQFNDDSCTCDLLEYPFDRIMFATHH